MGCCVETFLQGETFFLDWANQKDLVCSQWPIGPKLWVGYRILTMLYIVAVLIWIFIGKFLRYQWKFFTMVSHLAYILFAFNSVLKAVCAIKYYKWIRGKDLSAYSDEEKPLLRLANQSRTSSNNNLLQISWFTANIANVCAIFITISFWWPAWIDPTPAAPTSSFLVTIQIHGVNMVLALLDTLFVAQPTLLLHFYQPLCFELLYISFTAFYYLAGGLDKAGKTNIYDTLDWEKSDQVFPRYVPHNIFLLLASHLLLWLLASLRRKISAAIKK